MRVKIWFAWVCAVFAGAFVLLVLEWDSPAIPVALVVFFVVFGGLNRGS